MGTIINKSPSGIPQRIRFLRGKLSQESFADRLGISQTDVSRYESGTRTPSITLLTAIAAKFNVSLDWIVLGDRTTGTAGLVGEPLPKSSEDTQLLTIFRQLDRKDRTLLKKLAERLADPTL